MLSFDNQQINKRESHINTSSLNENEAIAKKAAKQGRETSDFYTLSELALEAKPLRVPGFDHARHYVEWSDAESSDEDSGLEEDDL